jgi:autotransporter-associated beta strand protein
MLITNVTGGIIRGDNGSGLNFDAVNGLQIITVDNAGSIIGNGITGDGDGVDVDGVVNITNRAGGVIRSANSFSTVASGLAYSEAISVGGGTITNAGLIEGLVASGNTNAVGRGISLVGNDITSGVNAGKRETLYANAVVINQAGGVIRGQSDSAIYAGGLTGSGYTVSIQNAAGGKLIGGGASSAAIVVASDYATTVTNAGLIDGSSSGKAIALGSGQNTVFISGGQAQVLGDIDGGSGAANVLRVNAGAGNGFSYANSLSGFANVRLESGRTVLSGVSSYSGTTTVMSGATLELAGANRLAAASSLELAGGKLVLGGDQSFASLALSASSEIDLGGSVLSFASVGSLASGAQLVVSHAGLTSLRFTGDLLGDASFQNLVSATTINGMRAVANFDGVFTNISAVPELNMAWLMAAGLATLTLLRRRQPR